VNYLKKKIMFFSTPAYGHLISEFPIIKKLIESGYEVDWYCTNKYKKFILESGANFIEYSINFEEINNLSYVTSNFYILLKNLLAINSKCYLEYINKVKDIKVDLIIYDSMCSFAKNIAKRLNIKSVCLCTTIAYNIWTFVFSNMLFSSIALSFKYGKKIHEIIEAEKKFRKENKIIKFNMIDIFVNSGDITIVFTPKELQPFINTFPKSFKFVGTTINDRISLHKTKYKSYDIYISLGTIFTENKELLNKMIKNDFVKNKKTIINIGKLNMVSNKENIELVSYTNQIELLKKCKLFINHGGINSIYEAISNKVFQVCIPQQEEQKMNAKIIAKKKIGIYMKNINLKKMKKIDKIIEVRKKRLSYYSNVINKYDGTKNAIQEIKKLLKDRDEG
jgi:glycosyltransferase, MGT family